MMSLISDIITEAYRESNLIAVGTTETAAEQAEALKLLGRFINSLFGEESGELFQAINIGHNNVDYDFTFYDGIEDWYIPLNVRLMLNLEGPKSTKLHPYPCDGARLSVIDISKNLDENNFTLQGNGRTIQGQPSITLNEDGFNGEWFYRDDIGDWSKLTNLELTDPSPFPTKYDDLLIIGLALRLAPRTGTPLSAESVSTYNSLLKKIKAQYTQNIPKSSELGLIRTPGIRWIRGYYSWPEAFNRGYPVW